MYTLYLQITFLEKVQKSKKIDPNSGSMGVHKKDDKRKT